MITDILPYVGSYDNVRAAVGLGVDELPDSVLELPLYASGLSVSLNSKSGVYAPETTSQTLQEIFDRPLADTDPMYDAIQLYSVYVVAQAVAANISMWAVKTKADGKSTVTRFSGEDTYNSIRASIYGRLGHYLGIINGLLGISNTPGDLLSRVAPAIDVVTGDAPA